MRLTDAVRNLFSKPYATVGPAEAAALVRGGAILVDVRERPEWQAGHAPEARHIPLGEISARAGGLPSGRAVITVCRSGARSARAAALLAAHRPQVANLAGGMRAWAREGLPVVARGGGAGHVA